MINKYIDLYKSLLFCLHVYDIINRCEFRLFFFYFSICSEQSIIGARASVMVYDDNQKKWMPSGTSSGLSKVHIYHHQQNNTFRVVGRKLQDHEVVINCSILKGLKYNQATPTFHQWRDSKFVYGLNFSSQQDAEAFARAMLHALEVGSVSISISVSNFDWNQRCECDQFDNQNWRKILNETKL